MLKSTLEMFAASSNIENARTQHFDRTLYQVLDKRIEHLKRQVGEPFIFRIPDYALENFLAVHGLYSISDLGEKELDERYLIRMDRSPHVHSVDFARIVHAGVNCA